MATGEAGPDPGWIPVLAASPRKIGASLPVVVDGDRAARALASAFSVAVGDNKGIGAVLVDEMAVARAMSVGLVLGANATVGKVVTTIAVSVATATMVGKVVAIGLGAKDGSTDHAVAVAAENAVGLGIAVASDVGAAGADVTLTVAGAVGETGLAIGVDRVGDAIETGVPGIATGSTTGDSALAVDASTTGAFGVDIGATVARTLDGDDPPPAAEPIRNPIAMLPAIARNTTTRRATARFCPIHVLEERGEHHSRDTATVLDLAGRAWIV
jgi:hypothetical protein